MKKIMENLGNVVYWSTLVGPIYSLIVGTIKGFIGAVQSIREDERVKAQREMYLHPDEIEIDLSDTQDAFNFSQVVNVMNKKKGE